MGGTAAARGEDCVISTGDKDLAQLVNRHVTLVNTMSEEKLDEAGVLEPMRFEATQPNGQKVEVEGFLAVNAEKLRELPDAKVIEFHKTGLLQLLEMHRLSLSNMGRLAQRRGK